MLLFSSLMLPACQTTSGGQSPVMPETGLSVAEIYQQEAELSVSKAQTLHHLATFSRTSLASSTKSKDNESFHPARNLSIAIHFYPKVVSLDDEEIIKPAYDTEFFLYKHNQYAFAWEND